MPAGKIYKVKRSKKKSVKSVDMKLNKVIRAIRKANEVKFKYQNFTGTTHATNPANLHLTNIAEGTTDRTRIGHKINVLSVNLNIILTSNIGSPAHAYRIVLYRSKNPIPNLAELYLDGGNIGVKDFRNNDHLQKYKILYDKKGVINSSGVYLNSLSIVEYVQQIRYITVLKKNLNLPVNYFSEAEANVTEGPIYLSVFTDTGVSIPLAYNIQAKVRYLDN